MLLSVPDPTGEVGEGKGKMLESLTKELDLTADQVTKIKEIFKESRPQMKALHEDASMDKKAKRAKMKEVREATHAKIRPILTAEQAVKFDAFVAKEKQGHSHHN